VRSPRSSRLAARAPSGPVPRERLARPRASPRGGRAKATVAAHAWPMPAVAPGERSPRHAPGRPETRRPARAGRGRRDTRGGRARGACPAAQARGPTGALGGSPATRACGGRADACSTRAWPAWPPGPRERAAPRRPATGALGHSPRRGAGPGRVPGTAASPTPGPPHLCAPGGHRPLAPRSLPTPPAAGRAGGLQHRQG
jgi:hypothetical protein